MSKFLFFLCFLVYLMILIGGLTRLTQSGLSMVNWDVIMGVIPPLNESQWQESFKAYQNYPQYQKDFPHMTLLEYKRIFYWEYAHRLLGRVLGLFYFFGLMIFSFRKNHSFSLKLSLWGGFFLLSFQGLLGWYMVKSGLIDKPEVSSYRLTTHLGLAFFIFGFLFWMGLREIYPSLIKRKKHLSFMILTGFCFLQILYGGFMAGLKAGKVYNTFPAMHGRFWPYFETSLPVERWFFEEKAIVQFIHRGLAWLLAFLLIFISFKLFKTLSSFLKRVLIITQILFVTQFILGVLTLLFYVPLSLSVIHQSLGFFTFLSFLFLTFKVRKRKNF